MAKQTKRRRSKKRRPDFFQKNKFWLILMGLAGLVVVSLVIFARVEEQPAPLPDLPPVTKPVVDYTKEVYVEVEALLSAHTGEMVQRDLNQKPARYSVEGALPSGELMSGFRQRIAAFPGDYAVEIQEERALVVEKAGQAVIVINFVPPAQAVPAGPLVAIIMDDLGRSTYTAKKLISISQHVTFSIMPIEQQAAKIAEMAYAAGREVMLHVPMEPQGYPAANPGHDALFVKYGDDEIRRRFSSHLDAIPHVSGTNNHMGSRFTEDARALAPVMEVLYERGLFFIDSRTTGRSQVTDVAKKFAVPTMNRDVFLDNVAEVEAISRQLEKLEGKARKQGAAIGICHPYPETLEALRQVLPQLAERGIVFVPVSVLLERQAAAQGS